MQLQIAISSPPSPLPPSFPAPLPTLAAVDSATAASCLQGPTSVSLVPPPSPPATPVSPSGTNSADAKTATPSSDISPTIPTSTGDTASVDHSTPVPSSASASQSTAATAVLTPTPTTPATTTSAAAATTTTTTTTSTCGTTCTASSASSSSVTASRALSFDEEDVSSMSWRLFNTRDDRYRFYGRGEPCTRGVQPFHLLAVIDVEATCEEDTGFAFANEIIEFPAVFINTFTLKIEAEFHRYVRPTEHPILSRFCQHLTGIKQHTVNAAKPLPDVLNEFHEWLLYNNLLTPTGKPRFACCTDGPWDLNFFLAWECKRKNIPQRSYFSKWVNVRWLFQSFFHERCNIESMLSYFGQKFVGHQHSGLWDSRNIANLVAHMIQRGCPFVINDGLAEGLSVGWEVSATGRVKRQLRMKEEAQVEWTARHKTEESAKRKTEESTKPKAVDTATHNTVATSTQQTEETAKHETGGTPKNSHLAPLSKEAMLRLVDPVRLSRLPESQSIFNTIPTSTASKEDRPPLLPKEPTTGALVDFFVVVAASSSNTDIIEVGSTIFNVTTAQVEGEFIEIVRSTNVISLDVTEKTGVTQEMAQAGKPLEEVMRLHKEWAAEITGDSRWVTICPAGPATFTRLCPSVFSFVSAFKSFYSMKTEITLGGMIDKLELDFDATCENIGIKEKEPLGALKKCYKCMCVLGAMIDDGFLTPNAKPPGAAKTATSDSFSALLAAAASTGTSTRGRGRGGHRGGRGGGHRGRGRGSHRGYRPRY
ncbi:3'-5' exoribonuclease 1 [Pelomyxa schiedti]|nr:3'-5' exoribonuclease 1 [Pelomyxa schiedti]